MYKENSPCQARCPHSNKITLLQLCKCMRGTKRSKFKQDPEAICPARSFSENLSRACVLSRLLEMPPVTSLSLAVCYLSTGIYIWARH